MSRMDWQKASAKERVVSSTDFYATRGSTRQTVIADFVREHGIGCFKCGQTSAEWAKSGTSKRGPWAICTTCVGTKK